MSKVEENKRVYCSFLIVFNLALKAELNFYSSYSWMSSPPPRPLNLAVDNNADNGPGRSRGPNGSLFFLVTVHTVYTMCIFTSVITLMSCCITTICCIIASQSVTCVVSQKNGG